MEGLRATRKNLCAGEDSIHREVYQLYDVRDRIKRRNTLPKQTSNPPCQAETVISI
jgi:hypothetical protein